MEGRNFENMREAEELRRVYKMLANILHSDHHHNHPDDDLMKLLNAAHDKAVAGDTKEFYDLYNKLKRDASRSTRVITDKNGKIQSIFGKQDGSRRGAM